MPIVNKELIIPDGHYEGDPMLPPEKTKPIVKSSSELQKLETSEDRKPQRVRKPMETKQEKRSRYVSLFIIYFSVFLSSLGFSIVLTGIWPYLQLLDPEADKTFLGWVISANPFGQLVCSPLIGWLSNRLGSIRIPSIGCMVLFIIGNMWYSLVNAIHSSHEKYWMIVARLVVGASSASIAACRTYLSAATTIRERTTAVAMVSLAQALGFILGPAIQAALTPIGKEGYQMGGGAVLNMYTAAGWVDVALGIINLLLFLPCIFKESDIATREAEMQCARLGVEDTEAWKNAKLDYVGIWACLVAFFVTFFSFVLLETLATPLTMDQFGWTAQESMKYMGIVMSVGGVISSACFGIMGPLSRRFDERKLLILGGFVPMIIAVLCFFPAGSTYPPIAEYSNSTTTTTTILPLNNVTADENTTMPSIHETLIRNSSEPVVVLRGCPPEQEWCRYTPAVTIEQFVVGYALTTIGYPFCLALISAVYSKVLGALPQGIWMGILTGVGSFARVVGPVFISYVYTRHGIMLTFGLTAAFLTIAAVQLTVFYKRIAPLTIDAIQSKAAKAAEVEETRV